MLAAKVVVWILCLLPAARLIQRGLEGRLTANPIEYITLQTGWWALVLLLATLAITPLRRLTGWNRLIRVRRLIGLFAFFYATLHLLTYITLDRYFDFSEIGDDILRRPYITVGFLAFLMLLPLAVTSTRGWIRRLGRRWQLLHWLIYPATALAVLHFYWKKSAKADVAEPTTFAILLAGLLGLRLLTWLWRRRRSPTPAA
ncbi:MAG TPA: protein-methionine-sulfoxide reductase heme-binding subunit MsrQ [Longimicrobiales bacterium]|nr:protein-methionine-sulfoxide reductase heme-binding subunit MsrQ [Longimicrobiales bacterium]